MMTKTLYVPDTVLNKVSAKNPPPSTLDKLYDNVESQVPEEAQLSDSALERLPQPTGWRILILPYRGKTKTEGGIHLPDQAVDREGDWVIFGRYAGSRFKIVGGEVRLLNDDEILAKIDSPHDILHTS